MILEKEGDNFAFTGRNMRPRFKRLKAGDIFLIEMEVSEEDWNILRTIPENAMFEAGMVIVSGDEHNQIESQIINQAKSQTESQTESQTANQTTEPTTNKETTKNKDNEKEKVKEVKGPYGNYWREMFKRGFNNNPALLEWLNIEHPTDVKETLKKAFKVDSLTYIDPDRFEHWCMTKDLHSMITLSRQAQAHCQSDTAFITYNDETTEDTIEFITDIFDGYIIGNAIDNT